MVTQNHGEFTYVGDAVIDSNRITLSEAESHHLTSRSPRQSGEKVMATDGRGNVYLCKLLNLDTLEIVEIYNEFGESNIQITLICGCLQGDTSRDVVSSAVQLGVRNLWWVKMARSQEMYTANKIEKLERVAVQSTKQTGRARLIGQVHFKSLQDALTQATNSCLWVAHPDNSSEASLFEVDTASFHSIVVGPEGGFDVHELELLNSSNARFIGLGSRRLRSEVAAAAGLMYLLTRGNDL
ncbi:MAG: RsmE family RNA methyltransferase [bacterium]|nr:RsmE family RNA methyltransferase [bacterium]